MKAVKTVLALMSLALAGYDSQSKSHVEKDTPESYKRKRQHTDREILLRKGLKEWTIDGITVVALNEKNAIRKVNKIKNETN